MAGMNPGFAAFLATKKKATGKKKGAAKAKPKTAAKAKPDASAPLGQGGRFAAVEAAAKKSGAKNPAAVAAAVGRKKYGAQKMVALAAAGRKGD